MRSPLSFIAATTAFAAAHPALAASAAVTFEIPRVESGPARKPYVAVWLEDASGKQVKMVAVFHDQSRIGERWIPELRTWWRTGGRGMTMPADGISRPTQAAGRHTLTIPGIERLAPGRYVVAIEAARERGGRELLKTPFDWKPGRRATGAVRGNTELGAISVSVAP